MIINRSTHTVSSVSFSRQLATLGLAVVFVFAAVACTNAEVETGGNGGTGASSNGTGGHGAGGGIIIKLDALASTGGTTGCTDTSGCTTTQVAEGCGDGINNQSGTEECDDGNAVPGDGCNGICKVEVNWNCPKQGKCARKIQCGNSLLDAGEVCDDGNTLDNDGCNSDCTKQDPAYLCIVGQPCKRISVCGDSRIESGEKCDDGNSAAGDGCSTSCQLEDGWVCPQPGAACKRAPFCGDGVVQSSIGEVCDDGNTKDNDGCSTDCKTKGTGCICIPGQPCTCPTVKCGNGKVDSGEACDDGNTQAGDGCSDTCTIEKGYACPFTNAPCVADCGDGIVLKPMEECDPAGPGTNMDKACSSTCKFNAGWACSSDTPPQCHQTVCGDKIVEGSEGCDDGNTLPNDGCSPTCHSEPDCNATTGQCTSKCGDALIVNEECDDGNTNDGDGCSHDCKVESGFECKQPPSDAETMTVPVTYRDFKFHNPADFEPGVSGSNPPSTGLVKDALDSDGKPVFAGKDGDGHITSADTFKQWYRDVAGTNSTYVSTILLHNNGKGGFVNWWKDNEQWTAYLNPRWCSDGTCSDCNAPAYVADGTMKCFAACTPWGNTQACVADIQTIDGNPLFFPLDTVPGMITPTSELTAAKTPPIYSGNWTDEPGAPLHNFSFTSEVRYWFSYNSSNQYTLDFTGDDDVWVFVNRKLAVDMGGIHTPVTGNLVLDANGNGKVSVSATEGSSCTTTNNVSTCTASTKTVSLGLTNGGVYEIAVFQAERQTTASTYKLTLSGFNENASACGPICGDGVVSPGEQCDNGKDKNLGGYNQCTSDCLLGPYCGDKKVTDDEQCDNGKNDDDYGSTSGCGPDCKFPARCGDSIVQTAYDEECDDGSNNVASTDTNVAYNGCMSNCKLGGRCGDGVLNGTETCDDGVNDGSYDTCNSDCTFAARCGDGVVQEDYGEECEPTMSDDPNCTIACRKPGGCGDGIIEVPEQCDDGANNNNGDYGTCAPSCVYAPYCGDGIANGPEECDDGVNDGTYGGCTKQCKLGPHCGDNITQTDNGEQCDHGAKNGLDGLCSAACKNIIKITT